MRMKRYARKIDMLSQCKDAIDNPAALFARMARITRRELSRNFGRYSRRVSQSGACSSSDVITIGGRKSEKTMEDKLIVVYVGTRSCTILLRTFIETEINFAMRLELPDRSPSHDANSHLLCREFDVRIKRISRANEASKLKMFKRPTTRE